MGVETLTSACPGPQHALPGDCPARPGCLSITRWRKCHSGRRQSSLPLNPIFLPHCAAPSAVRSGSGTGRPQPGAHWPEQLGLWSAALGNCTAGLPPPSGPRLPAVGTAYSWLQLHILWGLDEGNAHTHRSQQGAWTTVRPYKRWLSMWLTWSPRCSVFIVLGHFLGCQWSPQLPLVPPDTPSQGTRGCLKT